MATSNPQAELKALQEQQAKQADAVRKLKADKAAKPQIDAAVEELNKIKALVEKKSKEVNPDKVEFPRDKLARVLTQRFFYIPSFEIYGGVAGLYDLGPPATAVKANLLNIWRQHFVLQENMLEVDCTSVTPHQVFKASGHVAKFADLMVRDVKTGACYRADHLLEQHLDVLLKDKKITPQLTEEYTSVQATAGDLSRDDMEKLLTKYNVKAPETNNDITPPEYFNLMFKTNIGPIGTNVAYLRPETAQGIFVNFKRLLEYNAGQLPFAGAQIGQAFRNEISPRSGLLRVREFTLAEVEHFVDPDNKQHPRFAEVANLTVLLYPRKEQNTTHKPVPWVLGDAVKQKIIANETLGYFVGRTFLFLTRVGIKADRLRFRQHLQNEMAHYATDCWDAEIQNSYGWIESVGIADRSCYDLQQHANESNVQMVAFVDFPDGPREVDIVSMKIQKEYIGKTMGKNAKSILGYLEKINEAQIARLATDMAKGPVTVAVTGTESITIDDKMVSFTKEKKRVAGKNIVPGVIEPSFGIGRILYSILEHNYYTRENDEQRTVFSFPPALAPVKVAVFPLVNADAQLKLIPVVTDALAALNISNKIDTSGTTIGKKYARVDEVGIPFAITIDQDSVEKGIVTVRERDSTEQIKVPMNRVAALIAALVDGKTSFSQATNWLSSSSSSSSSSMDDYERRAIQAEQQLKELTARLAALETRK